VQAWLDGQIIGEALAERDRPDLDAPLLKPTTSMRQTGYI
jgi:hypothetical protein